MTRPDWWDAPQSEPVVGRGETVTNDWRPAPVPQSVPLYKTITPLVAMLGLVVFAPIGYVVVGNWSGFWVWFAVIGIPAIGGFVSGWKSPTYEEINAQIGGDTPLCGQSDTVATVERSQPLEQLRGRLSR